MNNPDTNSKAIFSAGNLIVIGLVVVSYLMLFFGSRISEVNWGLDQLSYFSNNFYLVWIVLSVLSIALLFFDIKKHFLSDFLESYLWGDKKLIGRIALLVVAAVIFYLFRFEAFLYGDGYIRISNFAQKNQPIFKWFEYGSTFIPYLFYELFAAFGYERIPAAIAGYQLVSIASGLVFVYFAVNVSDRLYDHYHDKLVSLCLIMFSGLTMLFLGMVEVFPILLALGAAFYYQMVRVIQDRNSNDLLWIWILIALGMLLHIICVTLIPVGLYLTVRYLIKNKNRGFTAGLIIAAASIIIGLVALYINAAENIWLRDKILLLSGKSPEAFYSIFSKHHMLDILNLLFLMTPLFLIYVFGCVVDFKNVKKDNMTLPMWILFATQFFCIWIIDPKDGMIREIPLFGFLLISFLFRGIYSAIKLKKNMKISQSVVMAISPAALILILPAILMHISPSKTETSFNKFLEYNEYKTEPTLIALRDYFIETDDMDKANEYDQLVPNKTPGALESRLVGDLFAHERYSESLDYANQLVERYPYNYYYRIQRSHLLKYYNKLNDAKAELDTAIMLAPYNTLPYHYLSEFYRETKQESKCIETLEKGTALEPDNVILLIDLIGYYYRTQAYDSADGMARVVIDIDSLEPYPYMYRGLIADNFGQLNQATEFYNKFIELNENLREVPIIRKRLNEIFLQQRDKDSTK